ncbi:MAG TPA: substrate-binding domain-containing protein [Allosphingosinicella sp.]|nr:substrate-binding domain-containing protein [Allosphingosinicella sp.]
MKRLLGLALPLLLLLGSCSGPEPRVLRVCADPNNLPFSNRAGQGFENRLAELVAAELGASLSYTWWAQRRGNVRETLNAGLCDLIPGVGAGLEMLATTAPYYNSAYFAVTRADRGLDVGSFDDPRLRRLRIGVQMIGDDFSNTPPAHALARRGLIDNVRGYMVYGDYARSEPQANIVAAVAAGEIDVAFVWGPVAGFFARRQPVGLDLTRVAPEDRISGLPMAFAVAMGVRRDDRELKREVDEVLRRRSSTIAGILAEYGVPTVPTAPAPPEDDD